MSDNTTSALFSKPPNTQRDYYIVRGLDRTYGTGTGDPNDGFKYFAAEPSDYVHETKSVQVIVGLVIMMLTILIPTVTRVMLRASNPAMEFGSDDWAIILAACIAIIFTIVHIIIIVQGGGGYHIWEVTYEQYNSFVYWGNVATMLYYVTVTFIKISITLFLRRIAHQAFLPWRIFCDIFLASLALYVAYVFLSTSLYCNPIPAGWNLVVRGQIQEAATCLDTYQNARALSIVHLIQGVILLSSPIIMLWKVRMNASKKIRLFSFWVVGGLAVLGALLDFLLQTLSSDYTWSYTSVIVWAAIDICFGMLTASLPVLDAFIELAWNSTKRRMSTGKTSRGEFRQESQPHNPIPGQWTDKIPPVSHESVITSRAHPSESQEHFAQGEETVEMGIMRTQDFEVRYSTVSTPESIDQRPDR